MQPRALIGIFADNYPINEAESTIRLTESNPALGPDRTGQDRRIASSRGDRQYR